MPSVSTFGCQRSSATRQRHVHRYSGYSHRREDLYRLRISSTEPSLESGGDSGARTRSLRLAKPALSQLSYIPASAERSELIEPEALVGLGGLEPPTSRLSGVRSNQLSYRPTPRIDAEEIEPAETSAAPTALPRPDPQEGSQPGRTRTWKRPPGWDSSRRHTTSGLQKERE